MLGNFRSIAGAAIIFATLTAATAQAKPDPADAPKCECIAQKAAKAPGPYFFLVLGVGF